MTTAPVAGPESPADRQDSRSTRPTRPVDLAKKYWWVAAIAVPIVVAVIGIVPDVRVAGFSSTAGTYTLFITPRQAFDRFEPNDSILEPREIAFAQEVEANVMDPSDSDVYRVAVPAGPLRVTLTNRSATLSPDITVFDDSRSQVAKEYQTTPGSHGVVQTTAKAAGTWYVRVNGFSGTSGAYTLKVAP